MRTKQKVETMPCFVANSIGMGAVVTGLANAVKAAQDLAAEGIRRGAGVCESIVLAGLEPVYVVAVEITPKGEEPKYIKGEGNQ